MKKETNEPKRNQPSSVALNAFILHMASTSLPRLLAEKEREKRRKQESPKDWMSIFVLFLLLNVWMFECYYCIKVILPIRKEGVNN